MISLICSKKRETKHNFTQTFDAIVFFGLSTLKPPKKLQSLFQFSGHYLSNMSQMRSNSKIKPSWQKYYNNSVEICLPLKKRQYISTHIYIIYIYIYVLQTVQEWRHQYTGKQIHCRGSCQQENYNSQSAIQLLSTAPLR